MDILELFPIDFDLTPLARLRLRQAVGGELAVIPLESLSMKRRRAFNQALGEALVDECSPTQLEDALPGLSTLAIPLLDEWELGERIRACLARHRIGTAADVARLSLGEIGLWPNVGRALQREMAAAAIDALSRGALGGSEAARDAVRVSLRERGVVRKQSPGAQIE